MDGNLVNDLAKWVTALVRFIDQNGVTPDIAEWSKIREFADRRRMFAPIAYAHASAIGIAPSHLTAQRYHQDAEPPIMTASEAMAAQPKLPLGESPAFPVTFQHKTGSEERFQEWPGMNLRTWIATQVFASTSYGAEESVEQADKLIAALEKTT